MAVDNNEEDAKSISKTLNIEYIANQLPDDKYQLIKKLKDENITFVILGNGVKDDPALAL